MDHSEVTDIHVSVEQVASDGTVTSQDGAPITVQLIAPPGESTDDQTALLVGGQGGQSELCTADDGVGDEGVAVTAGGDEQSEEYADGESVLQLNLTGESLQKFAKILHEKGLQTAEEAIQYFYTLHNKKDAEPQTADSSEPSTSQVESRPKRRPGRPRGSRPKPEDEAETSTANRDETLLEEDETWPSRTLTQLPDGVTKQPGMVVVDGVKKSTRRRKNPYSKSEYVPVPKVDPTSADSELDDEDQWDVDEEYEEEEMEGDEEMDVDIGGDRPDSPSPAIVPNELPDVALAGDSKDSQAIKIIQKKKLPPALIYRGNKKKLTANGKRVGRPKKRPKAAILWEDEEEHKKCRKCGEVFDTLNELRQHKTDEHGRPGHPYFCEECNYTAMFECDIKRHQMRHTKEKKYKCEICDFSTNWERNVMLHMDSVHANKEPWMCDKCDTKIYNHHKVLQHQLTHNPNAYKCPECELLFETLGKQQWHIENQHSEKDKHQCEHCAYTTCSSVNIRLHLKNKHGIENRQREKQPRRKKEVTCDVCNKWLINDEQRVVHMQLHEENNDMSKPFYCNVCDARSADINQMVRHRAIHTDDKPYQCQHCDYRTRWKKDLKTHEMIHTGKKNVHCPHCNYSCYTRQRLRAHLVKHDESRHHICPLCNMAFKSKQALRMHTMYHTGDATFACNMCDFRTVTEMRLKKHKLRHTDERNYSCNLCGKRFKQPHHVTQHRDIVHLGKPSYRERKRIALQQSAAEALGSMNATDVNFSQTYTVLNEDGSTTLVDLQTVQQQAQQQAAQRAQEDTQYVMVETPAGYQYVAVVMPEDNQQPTVELTQTLVGDASQVSAEANNTLEDAQILLSQATGVYYTTSAVPVGAENNQAVDTLVAALQPQ